MLYGNSLCRLSLLAGLIGIFGASLSGCGGSGGGGGTGGGGGGGGGSRAACLANTAHNDGRARWTILVYMNAANNLQPDSLLNIAQMASVGSDSNVNIVVQWKQANCSGCGSPSFVGTRRYLIRHHTTSEISNICSDLTNSNTCKGDTSGLDSDRLPDPATNSNGTSDMGNYLTLREFIQWGAQNYPADHLAVLIWDHGSGWQPTRAAGNRLKPRFRAVSQDDESGHEIETQQLKTALSSPPQPIDMLIFDCSLEQMIEVAYEVKGTARVMVGSEESPPGQGYPYHKWIADLKASGKNPCDVGDSIIKEFVGAYPTAADITQSVLDLSQMDTLVAALENFANTLRVHLTDQADLIQSARQAVQKYGYPDNKDLFHYASLIRNGTSAMDLQTAATNLQTALTGSGGAVIESAHGSFSQANSNGLAVYIPAAVDYIVAYSDLALARVTHWDEFLQSQVK